MTLLLRWIIAGAAIGGVAGALFGLDYAVAGAGLGTAAGLGIAAGLRVRTRAGLRNRRRNR